MSRKPKLEFEYLGGHRWGLLVDGELHEFDSFDEAADEFEALGGAYPAG